MKILSDNLIKRRKTIIDGSEEEFINSAYKIKCPKCSDELEIRCANATSTFDLDTDVISIISEKLSQIEKVNVSGTIFLRISDLPMAKLTVICENCGINYLVVIGAGEIQPARYKAILTGLFEIGN